LSTRKARLSGFFLIFAISSLAADDQPGLGATEQLVAAEGDDIGAVAQGLLHSGFFRQAPA